MVGFQGEIAYWALTIGSNVATIIAPVAFGTMKTPLERRMLSSAGPRRISRLHFSFTSELQLKILTGLYRVRNATRGLQ